MVQWRMEWVRIRACHVDAYITLYYALGIVSTRYPGLMLTVSTFSTELWYKYAKTSLCSQALGINIFLFNSYNDMGFVCRTGTEWFHSLPRNESNKFFRQQIVNNCLNQMQSSPISHLQSSGSHSNMMRNLILCVSFNGFLFNSYNKMGFDSLPRNESNNNLW